MWEEEEEDGVGEVCLQKPRQTNAENGVTEERWKTCNAIQSCDGQQNRIILSFHWIINYIWKTWKRDSIY